MHSGIAELVQLAVILLGLAAVVGVALHRVRFPFSIALVLVGFAAGHLSKIHGFELISHFELPPDLVFLILLPALLFESAFNLDVRRLTRDLTPIVVLAVAGLLVCVAMVGGVLALGGGVSLGLALLCGALVSATDPVAVIALFKELGAPKRLTTLIEGESLFNDGTAVVVFRIICGVVVAGGSFGLLGLVSGLAQFVGVCLGGIALGLALGWLFSTFVAWVDEQPEIEITLSVVAALTAFLVAEHFLHVSGVIATVVTALVMGSYGRSKFSSGTLEVLNEFWEYIAFLANSLIFLFVGLSIEWEAVVHNVPAILWGVLAIILARAVAAYGLIPAVNRRVKAPDIDRRYQGIIFWGDLRGALALVMALTLPSDFADREFVLSFALGIVLFTLLVKGLTLRNVMKLAGLDRLTVAETFEKEEALLRALTTAENRVERLGAQGEISRPMHQRLRQCYQQWEGETREELDRLRDSVRDSVDRREHELTERHCLALARSELQHRYAQGELGERAMRTCDQWFEDQLDRLRHGDHSSLPLPDPFTPWERWILDTWERLRHPREPPAAPSRWWQCGEASRAATAQVIRLFADHLTRRRPVLQYEVSRAALLAVRAALHEVDALKTSGALTEELAEHVAERYRAQESAALRQLSQLEAQLPHYVRQAQTALAANFALQTEQAVLNDLHEHGVVSDKVLGILREEIVGKLHRVRHLRFDESQAALDAAQEAAAPEPEPAAELEELARVLPQGEGELPVASDDEEEA